MAAVWLADNWWWLVPGLLAVGYFTYKVQRRGGAEALPVRAIYALFPILDAKSELRRQLPRNRLVILAILQVIFVATFIFLFLIPR